MWRSKRFSKCAAVVTWLVCVCATLAILAPAVGANDDDDRDDRHRRPHIFPPGSSPFGASYGEWSAAWWRWAFSLPVSAHPLFDTADVSAGQTGRVWFLGGSFATATATRDVTIPAGKALLFPVLNAECSNVEPPPFFGGNEAELRDCARAFMDLGTEMFATIDGRSVRNLDAFRVQSPLYRFDSPADGLFGQEIHDAISVSDGVWLMLAPLSAGHHTLHFGGTFATDPPFTLDVTYILRVRRGHRDDRTDAEPGFTEESSWGSVKELYRR